MDNVHGQNSGILYLILVKTFSSSLSPSPPPFPFPSVRPHQLVSRVARFLQRISDKEDTAPL